MPQRTDTRLDAALTCCTMLICGLACLRAVVAFIPFPYFDHDPFETHGPPAGLTPAWALVLDVATIIVAAALMSLHRTAGGSWRWGLIILASAGALVAIPRWSIGLGVDGFVIDDRRLAFSWVAAAWSAVALAHACSRPRQRVMAAALLLGAVGMLLAKGVVQVLVEHPATVAWFDRDPGAFLRSQGWEPDSAQARGYIRRLRQPEASGWFGMANVYASVVGAAAIGLGAMAAVTAMERFRVSRREGSWLPLLLLMAGSLSGAAGLVMSGSKGGIAAAIAGGAVVAVVWIAGRSGRISGLPGLSAVFAAAAAAAPLAAVVVRGLVGERIGELSLLFRWFYMQGACRVIGTHPLLGVGPAGFRDAYMPVKPALAVEDVVSPHCLPLDLLASFGIVGGTALLAMVVACVAAAVSRSLAFVRGQNRPSVDGSSPATDRSTGDDAKAVVLIAVLATLAAASLERAMTTPEIAIMRILGLTLWAGIACGVAVVGTRSPRALAAGILGGCVVLLLHSGIEITPTWAGAQTWFFAVMGVAGGSIGAAATSEGARSRQTVVAAAIPGLAAAVVVGTAPWVVMTWEAGLRSAWTSASEIGRIRSDLRVLSTDPRLSVALDLSPDRVRERIAALAGTRPARTPEELDRQLDAALIARASQTEALLARVAPGSNLQTARAADRAAQHAGATVALLGRPEEAAEMIERAISRTTALVESRPSALGLSHLGLMHTLRSELLGRSGHPEEATLAVREAIEAYRRASALSPRGVHAPVRLARLHARLGELQEAAAWSAKALQNDLNSRLDPVMGLSDGERAEMERLSTPGLSWDSGGRGMGQCDKYLFGYLPTS